MIKIEININGAKTSVEREIVDPVQAFDDLLNLLFVSGIDTEELVKSIIETSNKIKNNHKNESKDLPNTCSI